MFSYLKSYEFVRISNIFDNICKIVTIPGDTGMDITETTNVQFCSVHTGQQENTIAAISPINNHTMHKQTY